MKSTILNVKKNIQKMSGPKKYEEFLDSLLAYYEARCKITPAQDRYFQNIASEYSDEAILEEEKWQLSYDAELRDVALKCAQYYDLEGSGYFKSIVDKVLGDKPITKKEFTKMCMNKYAKIVIDEYKSDPKFETGEIIQIRKSNRLDLVYKRTNTQQYKVHKRAMNGEVLRAMILKVDPLPIRRAVRGARTYKLKLVNGPCVYANERDIKHASRRKRK